MVRVHSKQLLVTGDPALIEFVRFKFPRWVARELDSRHLHLQPKDGRGSLDFRVAAEKIRDAIKEWQDKYVFEENIKEEFEDARTNRETSLSITIGSGGGQSAGRPAFGNGRAAGGFGGPRTFGGAAGSRSARR